ncbi:MAG TPA: aminotransferase class V-fold PLP-dependent enzyme, partial [Aquifex aeolicus]|nr:aminotransferase class V-fold PLP-dependent enzyme [Aquifex aeolicus]
MSKMIYLDNAATTPLLPQVKEVLKEALEVFGNPSSIHEVGVEASERLKRAREEIASVLGVNPSEVIFNSGATEGNNTVFMDLLLKRKRGNVIISPIEHKSVSKPALRLREFGIEVRVARVGKDGIVDPQSVEDLMDKDTLLVSLMSVSNEFGTVQPVEEVARLCAFRGIPFHTDAVQSLGKVDLPYSSFDFATFSGHKLHAPKGIGFMIARKPLAPLLLGGGQEMGMRSG